MEHRTLQSPFAVDHAYFLLRKVSLMRDGAPVADLRPHPLTFWEKRLHWDCVPEDARERAVETVKTLTGFTGHLDHLERPSVDHQAVARFRYRGETFSHADAVCVERDADGRLHGRVVWPDGYYQRYWRATRVPRLWVEQPDHVNPASVMLTTDANLRAAGVDILGHRRLFESERSGVSVVHLDGDPGTSVGALVRVFFNPRLTGLYLCAACPRNGRVYIGVPTRNEIDGREIRTAVDAQAWIAGVRTEDYQHPPVRT